MTRSGTCRDFREAYPSLGGCGNQELRQFVRLDNHGVMAAIDLQHRPTGLAAAFGRGAEAEALAMNERGRNSARVSWGVHRLTERTNRKRTQACADPLKIRGIGDTQNLNHRCYLVAVALGLGFLLELFSKLRGIQIEPRLSVRGHQSVEVNEAANPLPGALGRTADDEAAIRMSDQDDVPEVIHLQHADNVRHMGVQVNGRTDQMCAVSRSGKRYRKRTMPGSLQKRNDPVPAPAAMPSPMNENKGRFGFAHR